MERERCYSDQAEIVECMYSGERGFFCGCRNNCPVFVFVGFGFGFVFLFSSYKIKCYYPNYYALTTYWCVCAYRMVFAHVLVC